LIVIGAGVALKVEFSHLAGDLGRGGFSLIPSGETSDAVTRLYVSIREGMPSRAWFKILVDLRVRVCGESGGDKCAAACVILALKFGQRSHTTSNRIVSKFCLTTDWRLGL
jgi:hypothetical protein